LKTGYECEYCSVKKEHANINVRGGNRTHITYVCMYKGWAIKLALAPRPLMIYCASPLAAAMIKTVAALRIVLAHGSKPA
jgi:hypothetical protein